MHKCAQTSPNHRSIDAVACILRAREILLRRRFAVQQRLATTTTPTRLIDHWSTSPEYRAQYQTDDEIHTIVRLLDLQSAHALADVGCGNGAFSLAAARAHANLNVFAFDALPSAIEAYRASASNVREARLVTAVAWADSIPLADESVDRVLCRAVLHHVPHPAAAYAEFSRILRPGGLL